MLKKILNRTNMSYADLIIAGIILIIGIALFLKGVRYFHAHDISPYTSWLYQHKDEIIKSLLTFAASPIALKEFLIAMATDIGGIVVMIIGFVFILTGIEGVWKNAIYFMKKHEK